jgi:hypothetical protein
MASANTPSSASSEILVANLYDSLDDLNIEDEGFAGSVNTVQAEEEYRFRAVFVVKVDKASDLRLRRHLLIEQAVQEGQCLQTLWEKSS